MNNLISSYTQNVSVNKIYTTIDQYSKKVSGGARALEEANIPCYKREAWKPFYHGHPPHSWELP